MVLMMDGLPTAGVASPVASWIGKVARQWPAVGPRLSKAQLIDVMNVLRSDGAFDRDLEKGRLTSCLFAVVNQMKDPIGGARRQTHARSLSLSFHDTFSVRPSEP